MSVASKTRGTVSALRSMGLYTAAVCAVGHAAHMGKIGQWPEVSTLDTVDAVIGVRNALPRLRAGDPLQSYKWSLAMRLRRLRQIAVGSAGKGVVKGLFAAAGDVCPVCSQPMGHGSKRLKTIDHIVALANGGSNDASNLRVICNRCNSRKASRA